MVRAFGGSQGLGSGASAVRDLGIPESFCLLHASGLSGGFPELGYLMMGVLMIRITACWGLFWGSPISGTCYLKPGTLVGSQH